MMRFLFCVLALFAVQLNAATLVTQTLGISGHYLTTQVGIGTPPQFFDLGIVLSSDKSVIMDKASQDIALDYQYDYVKEVFVPEASDSLNVTTQICRQSHTDSSGCATHFGGHYVDDLITFGGQQYAGAVRFCDLDTPRSTDDSSTDPLLWFMGQPIDGFLGLAPGGENILERSDYADLKELSFFINSKSTEPDNAGIVTFGGKDTTNCRAFYSFQSEDRDSWTTWTTQAEYNSYQAQGPFSTVFDLATDKLQLPNDVYKLVTKYFNGQTSYLACSSYTNIPDLKLTIYGKAYSIPISPYFVKVQGDNYYCNLNIDSSSEDDQIVLGRHLLENYCLYLDYEDAILGLAEFQTKS